MFTGFTPETIDFLWGIRMNNNKEWFTANKKQYTDFLYHPMKELGKELFEPFLDSQFQLNLPTNLMPVLRSELLRLHTLVLRLQRSQRPNLLFLSTQHNLLFQTIQVRYSLNIVH